MKLCFWGILLSAFFLPSLHNPQPDFLMPQVNVLSCKQTLQDYIDIVGNDAQKRDNPTGYAQLERYAAMIKLCEQKGFLVSLKN